MSKDFETMVVLREQAVRRLIRIKMTHRKEVSKLSMFKQSWLKLENFGEDRAQSQFLKVGWVVTVVGEVVVGW